MVGGAQLVVGDFCDSLDYEQQATRHARAEPPLLLFSGRLH
jgi:hypothetical protein